MAQTYDSAVTDALAFPEELLVPLDLTLSDRCDRCCAQAQHRVQLATGDLLLCGHHYYVNAEALAKVVLVPRKL